MISLTNAIKQNLDNGMYTIGVFLDLSKAFDSIPHDILLNKLFHYGIRGKGHEIISSYLHDRQQYVDLSGIKSPYLNITCGVPQGSILGPTLFLIYINDVYKYCNSKLIMYADDINILHSGKNLSHIINDVNSDLQCLLNWFTTNKLLVNHNKSNYI